MRSFLLFPLLLTLHCGFPTPPEVKVAEEPSNGKNSENEIPDLRALRNVSIFIKSGYSQGSGVLVTGPAGETLVLTNHHVVKSRGADGLSAPTETLRGVLFSGTPNERDLPLELVSWDEEFDLALLRSQGDLGVSGIPVPDDDPKIFETMEITGIGYPFGEALGGGRNPAPTFYKGFVSSLRRTAQNRIETIQLDANLNPGQSGGPIFSADGSLLGVACATILGTDIGFVIPVSRIRDLMRGGIAEVDSLEYSESGGDSWFQLKCRLLRPELLERLGVILFSPSGDTAVLLEPPFSALAETVVEQRVAGETELAIRVPFQTPKDGAVWCQLWLQRSGGGRFFLPPFPIVFSRDGVLSSSGSVRYLPSSLAPALHQELSWREEELPPQPWTIPLPGEIRQWTHGGAGRYLAAVIGLVDGLALIDLIQGEMVNRMPFEQRVSQMTCGGDRLVLFESASKQLSLFSLPELSLITRREAPFPGAPFLFQMGHANNRRLLVAWLEGQKAVLGLMDLETWQVFPCSLPDQQTFFFHNRTVQVTDSTPDGAFFALQQGGRSGILTFDGTKSHTLFASKSGGRGRLTPAGHLVLDNGLALDPAGQETTIPQNAIPSLLGDYYLTLLADKEQHLISIIRAKGQVKVRGISLPVMVKMRNFGRAWQSNPPVLLFLESPGLLVTTDPTGSRLLEFRVDL
jgi:S1-C subfamily serine protease